jgi:hypothetical protein
MGFEYKPVVDEKSFRNLQPGDRVRFVGGPYSEKGRTEHVDAEVVELHESLTNPQDYATFKKVEDGPGVPRQWRVNQPQFEDPKFYAGDGQLRYDGLFPEGHKGKMLRKD